MEEERKFQIRPNIDFKKEKKEVNPELKESLKAMFKDFIPQNEDTNNSQKDNSQNEDINNSIETKESSIPFDFIENFESNPFREFNNEELEELEESIKDDGLLHPIILWKKDENKYTILSGNNRIRALKNLGYNTLEKNMYIVKENLTYDEAKLIVVDANLVQRKNLLPSERAKAYRIQQEVLNKNNTKRIENFAFIFEKNDLNTSEQEEFENNCTQFNLEKTRNIYKYLRLNFLISDLLQKVDEKEISIVLGVELSYLTEEVQRLIFDFFFVEKKAVLNMNICKKIREKAENTQINNDILELIIEIVQKPKNSRIFKLNFKEVRSLTKKELKTDKEAKDYAIECIKFYEEKNSID